MDELQMCNPQRLNSRQSGKEKPRQLPAGVSIQAMRLEIIQQRLI
jgi:hypothetical protein